MSKNYDDLFNKFVDNELSNEETENINILLDTDNDFGIGLKTHRFVHNSLFSLPIVQAPVEITSKIMEQIASSISVKYEKHYFFRVILGIFGFSFLTSILIFLFYTINIPTNSETFGLLDLIKPFTKNIIPQLSKILMSDLIKSIGGFLSFIVLLGFYFTINEHKNFKERLKEL